MRFKLLLLSLPLIVTVKAVTEAQNAESSDINREYNFPRRNIQMPIHRMPKPLPRPIFVRPMEPPATTESIPLTDFSIATESTQPTLRPLPSRPPLRWTSDRPGSAQPEITADSELLTTPTPLLTTSVLPSYTRSPTRLPLGPRPIPSPHLVGPGVTSTETPSLQTTQYPRPAFPYRPTSRPRPSPLQPLPDLIPVPQPDPIPIPQPEPQPQPIPVPNRRPGSFRPRPVPNPNLGFLRPGVSSTENPSYLTTSYPRPPLPDRLPLGPRPSVTFDPKPTQDPEPQPDFVPEPPQPEPIPEPNIEADGDPDPQPQPDPQLDPIPEPLPDPIPAPQPEPMVEPQPDPIPIPQPEPQPRPIPVPNRRPGSIRPRPVPNPNLGFLRPGVSSTENPSFLTTFYPRPPLPDRLPLRPRPSETFDPKLTPDPEPQPDIVSEPQPKPIPEPNIEAEGDPEPQPQPDPQIDPIPEPLPDPIPQPELDPIPQPQPQPLPVPKPRPGRPTWIHPIPKPDTKPAPLPIMPIPQPIPKPQPIPRPVPVPVPQPQPIPPPIRLPDLNQNPQPISAPQPQPLPKPLSPVPQPQPTYRPFTTKKPTSKPYNPTTPLPFQPRPEDGVPIEYNCKQDGYYSIANECDTYIECKKLSALKYVCPDGLNFNRNALFPEYPCAYPSEVQCDSRAPSRDPQPTSECPRQYGFFPMNDGDCGRYLMCQEGLATIMNCPPGLAFNPQQDACDWPGNVPSCNPSVFQGFTCPPAPRDEYGEPYDWIYKYKYGQSCKEYVACQQGHPRLLSCDHGLAFDEASETCISEDYVPGCSSSATFY